MWARVSQVNAPALNQQLAALLAAGPVLPGPPQLQAPATRLEAPVRDDLDQQNWQMQLALAKLATALPLMNWPAPVLAWARALLRPTPLEVVAWRPPLH